MRFYGPLEPLDPGFSPQRPLQSHSELPLIWFLACFRHLWLSFKSLHLEGAPSPELVTVGTDALF